MYRAATEAAKARGGAGPGQPGGPPPTEGQQESGSAQGGKEEGPIIDAEVVDEKK